MFETLVVPLDGSRLAEHAIPYAIRLAQASHARLVLVQAVEHGGVEEGRRYLSDTAARILGQVTAVDVATPRGRPSDQILATVRAYTADGVVMTTHGRTGFEHLLHGSVTEEVLARSVVPVCVVYSRPGESTSPTFSTTSARLLVPQDGSDYDVAALGVATNLLGPLGDIVLVVVVAPPEHVLRDPTGRHVLAYLDQQEEARTRDARDYLGAVAAPLRNGPRPVRVKIDVRLGDPASGIAMAALDTQADLIVMATHGRTGINRAVFGSVAGCVLRTASTPVVLVHPANPATPLPLEQPVDFEVGPVPTF
jgi:nucleotide-binding universal stress UspA family protein